MQTKQKMIECTHVILIYNYNKVHFVLSNILSMNIIWVRFY